MMSGHVYYQSEKSASQFDDDWLCPVLNGEKEEKEVPKSICSALHSSELEANKMSVSDEEKISDFFLFWHSKISVLFFISFFPFI